MPGQLAEIPRIIRETFQGEASVGQSTLGRFYALHVVILPLTLVSLLGLHLLSVQIHGMSQGVDVPAKKSEKFMSIFIFKDLSLWAFIFLCLFTVSLCIPFDSFLPYPLLAPYNPLGSTPAGIKPEWYFFFVYYPLELLPFWVILLASMAVVGVLIFTPWIFKGTTRKTLGFITILISIYLIVMTIFGEQIYELFKH